MTLTTIDQDARVLYDGGWRSTDRDQLIAEYSLTEDDADALVEALAELEARA